MGSMIKAFALRYSSPYTYPIASVKSLRSAASNALVFLGDESVGISLGAGDQFVLLLGEAKLLQPFHCAVAAALDTKLPQERIAVLGIAPRPRILEPPPSTCRCPQRAGCSAAATASWRSVQSPGDA